jgi:hypothetical protein
VRTRLTLALAGVALAAPLTLAGPAGATGNGCPSARPTRVGGPIYGYPDNRTVHAFIGIELFKQVRDAQGNLHDVSVKPDGTVFGSGKPGDRAHGYAAYDTVNRGTAATGQPSGGERTWGADQSTAPLCVAAGIYKTSIEVYPRNASEHTDKSRYGAASHYNQPLKSGGTNTVLLRLPLRRDVSTSGITGYVNGYVTYRGGVVDPAKLRFRAFALGQGPQCGIEGFSASADRVAVSSTGTKTYYRLDALAGARCDTATQRYSIHAECTCRSGFLAKYVDIGTNSKIGLNFAF